MAFEKATPNISLISNSYFTVETENAVSNAQLRVLDMSGRAIYEAPATGSKFTLNSIMLTSGLYTVEIIDSNTTYRERLSVF